MATDREVEHVEFDAGSAIRPHLRPDARLVFVESLGEDLVNPPLFRIVKVERRVPHPQFKKIVRRSSKFFAHDETEQAKEGDKVLIAETRPLSKLKRWELIEVQKH